MGFLGALLWLVLLAIAGAFVAFKVVVMRFRRTGVGFLEPPPIFGNLLWSLLGIENLSATMKSIYDAFPDDRYVAIFEFFTPTIIIKDPEVLKKVTIKDFNNFHDIPFNIDKEVDPIFGSLLLNLKGSTWQQMRSTLSPAFTSSKMKSMFQFMNQCALKFVTHYEDQCHATGSLGVDMRDLSTRFTSDVIACTTFNLNVDSLKEKNNNFYESAKELSTPRLSLVIKIFGIRLFPSLMKMIRVTLFPDEVVQYLKRLVVKTMNDREESGEVHRDMLQLLIEAKKGTLTHDDTVENDVGFATAKETIVKNQTKAKWTEDDLVAQAITFILAGYSTSSTALSFLFYELALNEDLQKRLQEEIDDVLISNKEITYNTILNMTYMDMVVSEALRKWPPIPSINRLCQSDYDLGPIRENSNQSFTLKKGDSIWISAMSIHWDPSFWPNPEKFDPDRFSPENRANIKPNTYLPFGSGPRNCLGSRFALLQMKVFIFYMLSKFNFEVNVKTPVPMILSARTLFNDSKNDYWLDMKLRKPNKI